MALRGAGQPKSKSPASAETPSSRFAPRPFLGFSFVVISFEPRLLRGLYANQPFSASVERHGVAMRVKVTD